jgi:hypothetical protein
VRVCSLKEDFFIILDKAAVMSFAFLGSSNYANNSLSELKDKLLLALQNMCVPMYTHNQN